MSISDQRRARPSKAEAKRNSASAAYVLPPTVSRDALMENFYNRKATPYDRSIDMHVSHLRKKLEQGTTLIKTIRGVGYQFCRTPEDVETE